MTTMSSTTLAKNNNDRTTSIIETSTQLLHASGEHCAPSPESKALWTNGVPDHDAIKERMKQLLDRYLQQKWPNVPRDRWQWFNEVAELHRRHNEFYGEMHYLEDLLYAAPVLSLPVESTTTIVPYTPAQPRRRGRPPSGGRKPRNRRKRPEDEPY